MTFAKIPVARAHADLLALIDLVTRQISADPNNAVLFWRRGDLYRSHLDWKLAEADYDLAAGLDPKLAAVDLGRGKMFFDLSQYDRAKVELNKYLTAQPDNVDGLYTRARVLIKLGQRKAAIADYSRAIEHAPRPMPEFFLERAEAQSDEGKTEAALQGLKEGVKRLGPLLALQLQVIEAEVACKHFDAALSRVEALANQSERKEKWLAQRGEILLLAGRSDEAQKSFHAALEAIESLPPRLRQTPAMLDLKKNVNEALATPTAKNKTR